MDWKREALQGLVSRIREDTATFNLASIWFFNNEQGLVQLDVNELVFGIVHSKVASLLKRCLRSILKQSTLTCPSNMRHSEYVKPAGLPGPATAFMEVFCKASSPNISRHF